MGFPSPTSPGFAGEELFCCFRDKTHCSCLSGLRNLGFGWWGFFLFLHASSRKAFPQLKKWHINQKKKRKKKKGNNAEEAPHPGDARPELLETRMQRATGNGDGLPKGKPPASSPPAPRAAPGAAAPPFRAVPFSYPPPGTATASPRPAPTQRRPPPPPPPRPPVPRPSQWERRTLRHQGRPCVPAANGSGAWRWAPRRGRDSGPATPAAGRGAATPLPARPRPRPRCRPLAEQG